MENFNLDIIINARNNAATALNNVRTTLWNIRSQARNVWDTLSKSFWKYAIAAWAAIWTSIKFAWDFEKNMNSINTLFNDGWEQIKAYSKWIKELVANSPQSADDLWKSAYDIISAWITNTGKALETLKASSDLANAWLWTTAEATNILTSAVNAFWKQGYTSAQQADILFKTVKNGKTTVAELAQWFGWIAWLASTAWVKMTWLMAATAALTTTWLPASEAYTWLKATISNILKPWSEATKMAKKLGIEFNATALKTKWLSWLLKEIGDKTGWDIDKIWALFNSTEALNTVLTLTWWSAEAFNNTLADMESWSNKLNIAVKKQNEWFNNQVAILKNKLSIAMIDLWQSLLPVIKATITFMKEHKTLTKVILWGVIVIWSLLAILWTVWFAIQWVTWIVWWLTAAMWPLNIALRALFLNPVWLIIWAIALLWYWIYRLITDFEGVKKSLSQVSKHFITFEWWIKWVWKTLIDFLIFPLKTLTSILDVLIWTEFTLKIDNLERSIVWLKQINDEIKKTKDLWNNTNNNPITTLINKSQVWVSTLPNSNPINQDIKIDINLDNIQIKDKQDMEELSNIVAEKLTEQLKDQNRFN